MQEKARKFLRRKKQQKIIAPVPRANHPSKRKQWRNQQMCDAMEAVQSGTLSTNQAADMPRSTLTDRLSGRVVHGMKPGPGPYLTEP